MTTRTRLHAVLVAIVVATVMVLVTALPAGAHAALSSTEPSDGATVEDADVDVLLTFTEAVQTPASIRVTAPDGTVIAEETPEIAGDTARLAVTGMEREGTHTVDWRVVSTDGHPIEGTFTFDVEGLAADSGQGDSGQGDTPPADDDDQPADEPADQTDGSNGVTDAATGAADDVEPVPAADAGSSNSRIVFMVLGASGAGWLITYAVDRWRKRRRQ